MYKNQLQELAQRSCFNLPSYACTREGPDHSPKFKASVNFNGEIFEGPGYCTTLRQAEHAAAEVALSILSTRGPSRSLAARVLDETGVYKNLLQETAHRAGLKLPVYTIMRSGPGHMPVFTGTVELAGMNFRGEPAKTKKQAEKNAAMAAWSALRQFLDLDSLSQTTKDAESSSEEQDQAAMIRVLSALKPREESKPLRQRDQQLQVRGKSMLGHRENSSHNNNRFYRKWGSLEPLSSVSSSFYQAQQTQKQSSFLALPPTVSKIVPPIFQQPNSTSPQEQSSPRESNNHYKHIPSLYASNRPIPILERNRSHVKMQEVPLPLEEHLKDEEEWLNEKSDFKGKAIEKELNKGNLAPVFIPRSFYASPFPVPNTSSLNTQLLDQKFPQTQFRSRPFSPSPVINPSMGTLPMSNSPATATPIPRLMKSGGFRAPGIAPAVHIRSVIPVCAAPPMRPPANPTPPVKKAEEQEEEDVSAPSSKLEKLQL